jgi:hypothetical protein
MVRSTRQNAEYALFHTRSLYTATYVQSYKRGGETRGESSACNTGHHRRIKGYSDGYFWGVIHAVENDTLKWAHFREF